ncbi:MAG: TetR/AcrR family transcriptional regulator, partial [Vampirovibrionia bacterium]
EKTTNREICNEANTYPISVNYYCGSKDNLIIESFKYAFKATGEEDLAINCKDLSPEVKLKAIIRITVQMSFSNDQKGWFYKIVTRSEDILHQGPFNEIFLQFKKFHRGLIETTIKELFKDDITDDILKYAFFNFISQIIVLNNKNNNFKGLFINDHSDDEQIELLVDTIYTFIISGIKGLIKENNTVGDN